MHQKARWVRPMFLGVLAVVVVAGLGAVQLGCSSDSATQPEDPIVGQPPEPPRQSTDRDADLDHAPDGANLFD